MEMSAKKLNRIKIANRIENPLSLVSKYEAFTCSNGKQIKFESMRSFKLSTEIRDWCFKLFETNMKKIYEKSSSGYSKLEKMAELFDESAYYIIAYDVSNNSKKPVGFSHFRFDMDFESEVIYCYELQIEHDMRKEGLGRFVMLFLEELCQKLNLEKVILTCSKHNPIGQRFFKEKMRYKRDETDLNDQDPTVDYDILSKVFRKDEE